MPKPFYNVSFPSRLAKASEVTVIESSNCREHLIRKDDDNDHSTIVLAGFSTHINL